MKFQILKNIHGYWLLIEPSGSAIKRDSFADCIASLDNTVRLWASRNVHSFQEV